MNNEELLEKALMWALEHGASIATNAHSYHDKGCGCCVGSIEPPDELREVLLKVRAKLAKAKNKEYGVDTYYV